MKESSASWLIALVAIGIAALSATDHVGGWNDASRLATVEALVDHSTWIIDDSVFTCQTQDKLFIDGHFYSDKSPVPALILAGVYRAYRELGGASAAEATARFCRLMSCLSAGLAYVLALLGIDRLIRRRNYSLKNRLLLVACFALGTIALPYARSVNNHILLLAIAMWLVVALDESLSSLTIGTLAGLAYTIDLGAGPVFLAFTALYLVFEIRSSRGLIEFAFAALPWLILHHALNYYIGGTIRPANANPQYFDWPGCPFSATNMTGGWNHASCGRFLLYCADLLVGKKGLLNHNPVLYLAIGCCVVLLRQKSEPRRLLLPTIGWFVGIWLLYAATSRNASGECVSVRWFVPLLAPAFYWLVNGLQQFPDRTWLLALLTLSGLAINIPSWVAGPWSGRVSPAFWITLATTALAWIAVERSCCQRSSIREVLRRAA